MLSDDLSDVRELVDELIGLHPERRDDLELTFGFTSVEVARIEGRPAEMHLHAGLAAHAMSEHDRDVVSYLGQAFRENALRRADLSHRLMVRTMEAAPVEPRWRRALVQTMPSFDRHG